MSMNPIESETTTPSTASGTTNRISITNPKSSLQQQVFSVVSSSSSRHSLATSGKQYTLICGSQVLYIFFNSYMIKQIVMLILFTCLSGINEMNSSGNGVANGQANNVVIVQKHVNPRINTNNDETEDDSEDDMYEDDDMDCNSVDESANANDEKITSQLGIRIS